MVLSLRKRWDEKRDNRRLPIELPVGIAVLSRGIGFPPMKPQFEGVVREASMSGMQIFSEQEIPNGVIAASLYNGSVKNKPACGGIRRGGSCHGQTRRGGKYAKLKWKRIVRTISWPTLPGRPESGSGTGGQAWRLCARKTSSMRTNRRCLIGLCPVF